MSKSDKLLKRLFQIPPPRDFTWDELVTVMRRAKFKEDCSGGSHYVFVHESGFRYGASKTHPSGILKAYQVRDAKDALRNIGVTGEE